MHAPDVRFGLRFRNRPRGVFISGNSGSGKTTLERIIFTRTDQFSHANADEHVSVIALPTKGDVSDLPDTLKCPCLHLNVHDPGTRLSLAAPRGVPANVWINLITTIFCACTGMIAAWTCMANMIRWLLAVLNPNGREPLRWPSLKLLLDVAVSAPLWLWAAKPDYEKTLIGVLEGVTQSTDVFDSFAGLDIERDVIIPKRHLILEMPNVTPPALRRLIQNLIIAQLLCGRIHRHDKMDRTDAILLLDEMDQDATFEADQQFQDKMSPLAHVLRFGREYGIMTVVSMAQLSHASRFVLSEPQYHFIFNQSDGRSVETARNTLILPQSSDQMFPALPSGRCIVRESQGPWSHPMAVEIDYMPPGRGAPPQSYDTHPCISAQRLDDMPEATKALNSLVGSRRQAKLRHAISERTGVSEPAHRILDTAVHNRWAPAATLWKILGEPPPSAVQIRVRKELAHWGLARSELPRLSRTQNLLYLPTKAGYEYVHCQPPTRTGRGSITHQHISNWIALCAKADGLKAHLEWVPLGCKHATDCAVELGPEQFDVFEVVVTCTSNVLQHLTALETCASVRNITIVRLQKRQIAELQAQLKDEPVVKRLDSRLKWGLADTYLRRCFP
ncbi:MAG: hypothetical protein JXQ75_04590 [Phycisphaerae bacterium]|nr:hypothetical protein [Phycisphaerae bacterium]